jgi:hypothetical protein
MTETNFHQTHGVSFVGILKTLKRLSVLVGLIAVGWLAYEIFVRQLIHGTRFGQVVGFIMLWLILAYILIPNIHHFLTKLYVPDYFIGRIRTIDGLLSDPVNLAFIGSEKQLQEAMVAAGWVLADKLTWRSVLKVIARTVLRQDYDQAPVSPGYLFNEVQIFTYQQKVKNKRSARHHVRFFKVPDGWLMPGGIKVDFLAAGTFDRSVGLSYVNLQLTHHIASDTDIERDYIVQTLQLSPKPPSQVKIINNYFSAYHHRNGGGDSITTDGALPIIKL